MLAALPRINQGRLELWEDPTIFRVNCVDPHSPLQLFDSKEECLRYLQDRSVGTSKWSTLLADTENPTTCRFQLFASPLDVPPLPSTVDFQLRIPVPANWQFIEQLAIPPIYTNVTYPWKRNGVRPFRHISYSIPKSKRDNFAGVYCFDADIDEAWQAGIENDTRSVVLTLHGVASCVSVFVGDKFIGYCQDSMTEAEFDITQELRQNTLPKIYCVVNQWCDGSYLEDQDQWWLSGIFRDVQLQCRPRVGILDYHLLTSVADQDRARLKVTVMHSFQPKLYTTALAMEVSLFDDIFEEAAPPIRVEITSEEQVEVFIEVDHPHLWSSSSPYLYNVVMELKDADGTTLQVESAKVGIRTVDIISGQLCVNGDPLRISGVNRHEFDAFNGKVISEDLMLRDIQILKQNNFNAVRCSHYPNAHRWYELCDQYGLYVVDEANMETHGFLYFPAMSILQCDARWKEQILWRTKSMFFRSKNHASVIVYSLGNESGLGPNTRAAADWLRSVEKTRPVQYEGGLRVGDAPVFIGTGQDPYVTDIVCPMYHSPLRIARTVRNASEGRPLILCEYAHAMGNSGGGLHLYHDLFKSSEHPQLQGGFIWDLVDQGVSLPWYNGGNFGYGGDFGKGTGEDAASFCINGLLAPDRKEHPMMKEAKYLQQTVVIECIPSKSLGAYEITVRRLSNEGPRWEILCIVGYLITSESPYEPGHQPAFKQLCKAREDADSTKANIQLDVSGAAASGSWLRVEICFGGETPYAPAGHVIAAETFCIIPASNQPLSKMSNGEDFSATLTNGIWSIIGENYRCEFHSKHGEVVKFGTVDGRKLLETTFAHSFYRAPTENDSGGEDYAPSNRLRSFKNQWKSIGLHSLKETVKSCKVVNEDQRQLVVEVRAVHSSKRKLSPVFRTTTTYAFSSRGLRLDVQVTAGKATWLARSLPRIGLNFAVPDKFDKVVWHGCGPHECYADRKKSAAKAVYTATVEEMHHSYIVPGENGGRCDVDWLTLSDPASGEGIKLHYSSDDMSAQPERREGFKGVSTEGSIDKRPAGSDGAQVSVSKYSIAELDKARHEHEMKKEIGRFWVNVDTAHMGLGGERVMVATDA